MSTLATEFLEDNEVEAEGWSKAKKLEKVCVCVCVREREREREFLFQLHNQPLVLIRR